MKNKLIEKINLVYNQIEASEQELHKSLSNIGGVDKVNQMNVGVKGLKIQELNIELFKLIEIYTDIAEGSVEELPQYIVEYYNLFQELQKPSVDSDPEEIKKIKEMINSFKPS